MTDSNEIGLHFQCLRCGKCCHEVPKEDLDEEERAKTDDSKSYKRIPVFADEADRLEKLAQERNVPLRLIEDLVFPDTKNKKILVLTYRILLDNPKKVCPFYEENKGCSINEFKPLACRAYPLALKTEDAFNTRMNIDPLCLFTEQNREVLEKITANQLKKIYGADFILAMGLLKRSKQAIMTLMERQQLGQVEIPIKIDAKDYDRYLKEWDREILFCNLN
jgi:Fe-S-cluster containining protein